MTAGGWPRPRLRHAGDTLVLVELEPIIDPAVNGDVIRLADAVAGARLPGVLDVVPAYASLGVHVDPRRFVAASLDAVLTRALMDGAGTLASPAADRPIVEIPVRYGGDHGPDLDEVAAFAGCTTADVIARHTAAIYRVYMLGFLPGFAYLGGVDASIAMPRRDSPRTRVPAGSVGIAGAQTGVYPCDSPGGWRLVGRTSTTMFDADRETPALLAPGDRVRFVAMTDEDTRTTQGSRSR